MGALAAVLAIPYRSIKESIERSRKNKAQRNNSNKDKRQTKSAPGSRAPSLYKIRAASFEKKSRLRRADSEGAERKSQSLGHLPLVDVPWAESSGVESAARRKGSRKEGSQGKGKGNRRSFFAETEYAIEDDGSKGFCGGNYYADTGCSINSRVSNRFPPFLFGRVRETGLQRNSGTGIFGWSTERRFLHSSTARNTGVNKGLGDTNTLSSQEISINSADKMASDEDYMAFLNKANEDPSAGTSNAASNSRKVEFKTTDDEVDVPGVLVRATKDAWYVSDADEPFVVVALKHDGGLPDEETFARLIAHPPP
ncbi:hypothetical protein DID88_003319 [Monilinia fructigena]|uniref:Uncharacterized protein n=1 Tax=Monilinia fructigena TaxID=38457 RepID=A0A395IVF2_9HELO|nr:hypothetical protein DID88_003319 [Monilinia fructigena]